MAANTEILNRRNSTTKQQSVNERILSELSNRPYLKKIKELLRDKYNLDVFQYRTPYFLRRISMISKKLNTTDLREIFMHIQKSHEGYIDFLNTLTIHVTEFFRDKSMWNFIRDNLFCPVWEGTHKNHQIPTKTQPFYIWSAGCSSGQEPYSLAIMMVEAYRALLRKQRKMLQWTNKEILQLPFLIDASDVNQRIIVEAQKGLYDEKTLKNADPRVIHQYFTKTEQGYEIIPEIKAKVHFKQHDLFKNHTNKNYDLITCRNVVIYFTKDQQRVLFDKFWNALKPHGNLIIGKSELLPPESAKRFEMIHLAEHVFKKDPSPI